MILNLLQPFKLDHFESLHYRDIFHNNNMGKCDFDLLVICSMCDKVLSVNIICGKS